MSTSDRQATVQWELLSQNTLCSCDRLARGTHTRRVYVAAMRLVLCEGPVTLRSYTVTMQYIIEFAV